MPGKHSKFHYWCHRHRRKLRAIKRFGSQCAKCGYDKCIAALEFHHRDPTSKRFDWYSMRSSGWDKVVIELQKCDLLCANCHRELHYDFAKVEAYQQREKVLADRKLVEMICLFCNKSFKPVRRTQLFCSFKCGCSNRGKQWPDDLYRLVEIFGVVAVAKELVVSHSSVSDRLLLINGTVPPRKRPTKIEWPTNLPELVAKSSMLAVAKDLGVSNKSVRYRLDHHHV